MFPLVPRLRTRFRPRVRTLNGPRRLSGAAAIAVAATIALGTAAAHADVYKCAGDGGRLVYQEMPCEPGKELRNFQTDPPEITVLPGPPRGTASPPAQAVSRANDDGKASKAKAPQPAGKRVNDASERRHVRAGMSEGEVLARIGSPDVTSGQKNQQRLRWTWLPADGDPDTITTLTLVNGVVTDVERRVVKK